MSTPETFKGRRGERGMYRVMETRVWPLIEHLDGDSTRLFLYLWIGPHSRPYGILQVADAYVLHDLQWKPAQLRRAWAALDAADLVWRDGELCVIVPFLMSNPPLNENVVKGWTRALANLSDSPLYARLAERAAAWLTSEGIAWLTSKCSTISEQSSNCSETVSKLSIQYSGASRQKPHTQGTGVRMQGGTGGEGQGENPNAALRSASPLEAASLRAAVLGGPSDGERRAALERKDGNSIGTTCGTDLLQWFTVDAPRLGMSRTGAIAAMQRGGVSDADIGAALAELERRENGDNRDSPPAVDRERRCVAVTTAGLDCVRRPVRGSLYCALHQLMKHEQAPPETEHA